MSRPANRSRFSAGKVAENKGRKLSAGGMAVMHHNFLFDLDQTLLDFHASEYKALGLVLTRNGLSFSEEIYQAFKATNKSLWLELEKGTITRTELFTKRFRTQESILPPTA